MAGKASIKNGKKGGRPKGTKNPETLEREAVLKHFRQRTMRSADKLFNAQMARAEGMTFLYKIEKYYEGTGKNRILRQKKPERVESEWEIEQYLEGLLEDGDLNAPEDTYYFITTTPPDNRAIDSMLDRSLGKAPDSLDITSGGEKLPTPLLANVFVKKKKKSK